MKRFALCLLLLLPTVGCLNFRPVGFLDPDGSAKRNMDPAAVAEMEAVRAPSAPPPPTPANTVTAAEVGPGDADTAVRKLAAEIDSDLKGAEQFPNYPKVSRVRLR